MKANDPAARTDPSGTGPREADPRDGPGCSVLPKNGQRPQRRKPHDCGPEEGGARPRERRVPGEDGPSRCLSGTLGDDLGRGPLDLAHTPRLEKPKPQYAGEKARGGSPLCAGRSCKRSKHTLCERREGHCTLYSLQRGRSGITWHTAAGHVVMKRSLLPAAKGRHVLRPSQHVRFGGNVV